MKFDLSKFKKIKDTEHSAVMQHPSGHKIEIAKKVLSPDLKKQIDGLKLHMADGGQVSNEDLEREAKMLNGPKNLAMNRPDEAMRSAEGYTPRFPEPTPVQMAQNDKQPNIIINNVPSQPAPQQAPQWLPPDVPQVPNAQSTVQAAQNVPQQQMGNMVADTQGMGPEMLGPKAPTPVPNISQPSDPYGTQAYSDTLMKGIQDVKAGTQAQAEAEAQQAQRESDIFGQRIPQQEDALQSYTQHVSDLNQERENFMSDYKNQHLDQNRYIRNMSTSEKIGTVIGLILGGFGAIAKQDNAALSLLNKEIDRDVEAQKAEMTKSENLLTANFRQFGNMKDAVAMTQIMQGDILKNRLSEAAAKSKDPIVRANAQKAIGDLDMKNAGLLSQIAMRKSLSSSAGDPATKLRMLSMTGIIPEGQVGPAYKELEESMNTMHFKDNVLSAFDQLDKLNTIGGKLMSPLQTPKQVDAIKHPILAALSKGTAGRFTESDAGFLEDIFPAKGDSAQTIQIKRNRLNQLISEKMNFPILKSFGINMGNQSTEGRYGSSGQKKIVLGAPVATGQMKSSQ